MSTTVESEQVTAKRERIARPSAGGRMSRWLRSRTIEDWAWYAVILLALLLRVVGMGDKPLHHDESMHAFYSLSFARNPGGYEYDPLLHGPFQFHAVGTVFSIILALQSLFHVGGLSGSPWINDATARIVPTLLGSGTVVLVWWLRPWLGRVGALVAAFLVAVSPAFVYFSRFLREDVYFNFFMLAMVVSVAQFFLTRKTAWLALAFAATALAYATFEGIFLTLLLFLSFAVALLVWELADRKAYLVGGSFTPAQQRWMARGIALSTAGIIAVIFAKVGLDWMHNTTAWITTHQTQADTNVANLENSAVAIMLWVSILVALAVIGWLLWQTWYEGPATDPSGEPIAEDRVPAWAHRLDATLRAPGEAIQRLRARVDDREQFFTARLLDTAWVQWFVAAVIGWLVFVAMFWVIPSNIPGSITQSWGDGFRIGVGKGILQGLYYWMTQQDVARGGQPWYYYILLIPLYEQLIVIFGVAGAVYAVLRPTRFRAFLVWWFLGSLVLYSWAGEKMPWLTIQIMLPMVLLAGLVLGSLINYLAQAIAGIRVGELPRTRPAQWRLAGAVATLVLAGLLLIPMIHNMWVLTRQDAADGPLEMMVYVQTTRDVTDVMAKIEAADKVMYHGDHELKIGVGPQEEWPFYWYLRDYYLDPHAASGQTPNTYVTWEADVNNAATAQLDVLLLTPDDAAKFMAAHPTGYQAKQLKLRSWFDEAYKPAPCFGTKDHPCPASANINTGKGLGGYLTYGSEAPDNAKLDLGKATQRLWDWTWQRKPLGDVNGSFDFTIVVRDGVPIQLG